MSSAQHLREFISARLTAAAEEIFKEVEKNIVQYEKEIDRQRRLLDITWKPDIKLHRTELLQDHVHEEKEVLAGQQLCDQERNSGLDQEEFPEIKKEPEELCTRQGVKQIVLKLETDDSILVSTFHDAKPNSYQLFSQNPPLPERHNLEVKNQTDSETNKPQKKKKKPNALQTPEEQLTEGQKGLNPRRFSPCGRCGKHFPKKYLLVHMRSHTGERPFTCKMCGKQFTHSGNLFRHMRRHTAETFYACETCGERFAQRSRFLQHRTTHGFDELYSCDICSKKYVHRSRLVNHRKIHTGTHSCQICGKRFSMTSFLSTHMRKHTGENLFPCDICGNGFHSSGALHTHMRVHSGKK